MSMFFGLDGFYRADLTKEEDLLSERYYEDDWSFSKKELKILLQMCADAEEAVYTYLLKEHYVDSNHFSIVSKDTVVIENLIELADAGYQVRNKAHYLDVMQLPANRRVTLSS